MLINLALDLLQKNHGILITPKGRSMLPFICDSDHLIIESIKQGYKPRIGEIVLCKNSFSAFIHRVVFYYYKGGNLLVVTKGDSNIKMDPICYTRDIIGRVTLIERNRKSIDCTMIRWQIIGFLIALISLLIGFISYFTYHCCLKLFHDNIRDQLHQLVRKLQNGIFSLLYYFTT